MSASTACFAPQLLGALATSLPELAEARCLRALELSCDAGLMAGLAPLLPTCLTELRCGSICLSFH